MYKKQWRLFLIKSVLILGGLGFLFVGGSIIWAATINIPDFDAFFKERIISESTKIYDRTGETLLYDVHGIVRRTVVPLNKIAEMAKKASVAIEDAEFYQHSGIKPTAIIRAFLVNIATGQVQQGGSTITQQVIKNTLLTKDKTLSRKIKEVVLALKLERVMKKDDILALYLNETPYGGSIYGIEEAARTFFNKKAADLSLGEAAYLAALPQAPTYYSPYGNHKDKLDERKNLVLKRMRELDYITLKEEQTAKEEKVEFKPLDESGIKAPHFVFYVLQYLEDKYGREAVETQGFKVTTTLDWSLQEKAQEVVKTYGESNAKNFKANNAGMVAVDPKTGQILVMVGSRDYFDTANEGNFNITLAKRQPGSAFKPFVYATAFQKGYAPDTVVFDVPTQFSTNCPPDCYSPENYDNKYLGPISLRVALAQSRNIPAVKVLYLAGLNDVLANAKRFGINTLTDKNRYGLTLVLGGGEVTPLELTGAYSVFANDGIKNDLTRILKIENSKGQILEDWKANPKPVVDSNIARLITSILSDNNARAGSFGLNSPLYFPGREVAAKTGTTNDYRDAWVMGYTPSITVGAWAGNNNNSPMEKQIAGFIIVPMWNAFMKEYLNKTPLELFPQPAPVDPSIKPVLRGFWRGNQNYFIDTISRKLTTDYTPNETKEENVITQIHSILYWVDKNNPLGPPPSNPANDPQFKFWEGPVLQWAATNGIINESTDIIPKDSDNVHLPGLNPEFKINNPTDNQTLDLTKPINASFSLIKSPQPITKVEIYLNNILVKSLNSLPSNISLELPVEVVNIGVNELRVIVFDDIKNNSEQIINLSNISN
ncbi:MAG: PBP1A family penicillin-binding protein [bacterium]|nr:PBP1A family penicillin-binding protein [bacterium]